MNATKAPLMVTDTITPAQVAVVQSSFRDVLPMAEAAWILLYERIFTADPAQEHDPQPRP